MWSVKVNIVRCRYVYIHVYKRKEKSYDVDGKRHVKSNTFVASTARNISTSFYCIFFLLFFLSFILSPNNYEMTPFIQIYTRGISFLSSFFYRL